jgi:hypothetical protein
VFSLVDAILACLHYNCVVLRNFGLFALGMCSVFSGGRNFGLFV